MLTSSAAALRASFGKYRRLARYPAQQWRLLLLILSMTVASSLITVPQPWPLKILVDFALGGAPLPSWLAGPLSTAGVVSAPALVIVAAVASLALFALNSLLDVGLSWSWSVAGQRMVYDLAASLFHRLQRLSLAFHSRRSVGDSLSRLTEDTYSVYKIGRAACRERV